MKKIQAFLIGDIVQTNDAEAHSLYKKSSFGEPEKNKIQYMFTEALYLVETKKLEVLDGKMKEIKFDKLLQKFLKLDKKIQTKYAVYKDLRNKGYLPKTALKFGADFRVYNKGAKPGTAHAIWIVFTDAETNRLTWQEFSGKNRVAHSTKKKLLLAIVDEENSVTYYEVDWIKI